MFLGVLPVTCGITLILSYVGRIRNRMIVVPRHSSLRPIQSNNLTDIKNPKLQMVVRVYR